MAEVVKVKRDGPRGWHWITAASFDPAIHEVYSEAETASPDISAMSRREVIEKLRERQVEFDARVKTSTLMDKLKEVE